MFDNFQTLMTTPLMTTAAQAYSIKGQRGAVTTVPCGHYPSHSDKRGAATTVPCGPLSESLG